MTKITIDGIQYKSKKEAHEQGVFDLKQDKKEYCKNYMNKLYNTDEHYREKKKQKALERYRKMEKKPKKPKIVLDINEYNRNLYKNNDEYRENKKKKSLERYYKNKINPNT